MSYSVVMFMLSEPKKKLTVAKRPSREECRTVMNALAGKGWVLNRRRDLHSYGELILTFERD